MKKITFLLTILFLHTLIYAGTVVTNLTSLPNMGNVYLFHSSTSQRYTLSGAGLTANIVVSAPTGYEVSTTYTSGYSSSLSLTPVSGTITNTFIYVRFSPSIIGVGSGNIMNSSAGSNTVNIAVNATCINWSIPTSGGNYYSTVTTQTGATLKTALYNRILGHTSLSYTPGVWNAYATTDVQPSGKVWDVYSTRFDIASPYEYTLVTNQCGSYSVEGDCYNREHSFPQSWFASATPMTTDVHHLYASDGKVNGLRNNFPYGNVTTPSSTTLYGGKLGTGTTNYGYIGTVFEPIDEYKGDFARGYFYMATRYENLIAGWVSNTGATDVLNGTIFPCFLPWQLSLLREWNNLDPVSDKEIKRNNAIFALQNNRNPYVDSPQFVQRIWGGSLPAEPTVSSSNLTVTNNSSTSITLNWKSGNGNRRIVLIRQGSAVNQFPIDTIHYLANGAVNLAPQLGTGNLIVYNGTGSSVTLTNLAIGTNYHYAIVEYNGWYSTTNYQTSGILTGNSTTTPVQFLSFTAQRQEVGRALNWATACEINNDYFSIERSVDGYEWMELTTIKGAGNSNRLNQYSYLDQDPIHSTNPIYYRIKQTDFDNQFAYSQTVSVSPNNELIESVNISPNPFEHTISITFTNPIQEPISYTLKNLNGTNSVSMFINESTNETTHEISNIGHLPDGVYVLQFEYKNNNYRFKICKFNNGYISN